MTTLSTEQTQNKEEARGLSTSDSLRVLLQKEFIRRHKLNSAYSQRAFARFLLIDQSTLSKLLSGEREASPRLERALRLRLGKKQQKKPAKQAAPDNFAALADDEFELISEWYHFAILELAKTKDFSPDPATIAQRLGIHVELVRSAIERLCRLGFLRMTEGSWQILAPDNTWFNPVETQDARRILQRSFHEKSLLALDSIPFTERDHGSLTVAISRKKLPQFRKRLHEMRRELGTYFQEDGEFDEVYQLTIALFPLTKRKESL